MSIPDKEFKLLLKRVARMKADILFEEPCPLYETEDEDYGIKKRLEKE